MLCSDLDFCLPFVIRDALTFRLVQLLHNPVKNKLISTINSCHNKPKNVQSTDATCVSAELDCSQSRSSADLSSHTSELPQLHDVASRALCLAIRIEILQGIARLIQGYHLFLKRVGVKQNALPTSSTELPRRKSSNESENANFDSVHDSENSCKNRFPDDSPDMTKDQAHSLSHLSYITAGDCHTKVIDTRLPTDCHQVANLMRNLREQWKQTPKVEEFDTESYLASLDKFLEKTISMDSGYSEEEARTYHRQWIDFTREFLDTQMFMSFIDEQKGSNYFFFKNMKNN